MKNKKGIIPLLFPIIIVLAIIFIFVIVRTAFSALPYFLAVIFIIIMLKIIMSMMKEDRSSPSSRTDVCRANYESKDEIEKCTRGEL